MRTPPATAPFVSLVMVCVFSGCKSDSPRDDQLGPRMPVVSHLGPTEVEAELLRSQIGSIRLDGMAEFITPGMRREGACPASLVFKHDGRRLKLRLSLRRVMHGSLLKATTDGERICICNYAEKIAYEGLDHAYHDTVGVAGIFPDDLAEFFHISGIIGTRPSIFETQALAYQIQLIDIGESDDIKVFRRINVARSDLSVVGFADLQEFAHLRPRLTTVNQHPATIGSNAARLLLDRFESPQRESEPRAICTIPQLVIRTSTAAPAPNQLRRIP